MWVLAVLAPIAILGLLVLGAVVLFRRGGDALDLAPRNLLRFYLYVASLAGVVTLVVGLSGVLSAGLATAAGDAFVYGGAVPVAATPCPPPSANLPNVKCPEPRLSDQLRVNQQNDRRRGEDLLRGITFTVFGALFWVAHWFARRGVIGPDEGRSGLRRAYLMLGTVVFGLSTITLLPTGIYEALSYVLLPSADGVYRQGAGESLSGGLVTLPVWLIYLWLVVRDARAARAVTAPAA